MSEANVRLSIDTAALNAAVGHFLSRAAAEYRGTLFAAARQNVPVRTGALQRSLREEPITFSGPLRVSTGVSATAPYALFVHEGTRPHIIRPRRASVLAFPRNGRTVFARYVRHPGTRANPFLRRAADTLLSHPTISH